MDTDVPNWLTKELMKTALQSTFNTEKLVIHEVDIQKAVPKGTNFMCELFRVKVHYSDQTSNKEISLIVKAPRIGGLYEVIFKMGIVQNEVLIYKIYIPKLRDVLKGDEDITPISLYAGEENVIVMEDLNVQGYKMANRVEQLDYIHCEMLLKCLGKFHAASVRLHEDNPGLMDTIGKESCFRRELRAEFEFLSISQIDLLMIEISDWPEMKQYVEPLNRLRTKIWDLMVDCFETEDDEFKVLNHGDCWVTNFLYKYDDDHKPISIKLIDLQVTRYTSPAIDLIYFMHGSVREHIRCERYDELIDIYLESLNGNLDRFGCKTRNLERSKLKRSIEKRAIFEFYTNITLLPVVINDSDQVMEIEEMSHTDIKENIANNPFRRYLQAEKYRKLFTKRFIDEFSKHTWFTDLVNENS